MEFVHGTNDWSYVFEFEEMFHWNKREQRWDFCLHLVPTVPALLSALLFWCFKRPGTKTFLRARSEVMGTFRWENSGRNECEGKKRSVSVVFALFFFCRLVSRYLQSWHTVWLKNKKNREVLSVLNASMCIFNTVSYVMCMFTISLSLFVFHTGCYMYELSFFFNNLKTHESTV